MKHKRKLNSLFVRILCAVVPGILCASVAISAIIIHISTDIFMDTYGKSQEKAFGQIEKDLNGFYEDMVQMTDNLGSSFAIKSYLDDTEDTPEKEFKIAYQTGKDMDYYTKSRFQNSAVLVVGMTGRSVINNKDRVVVGTKEILQSAETKKALGHVKGVLFQYVEKGYTMATRNEGMVLGTKVLLNGDRKTPYAIVYILIRQSDFEDFYDYFTGTTNEIILLDSAGEVVSASKKEYLAASKPELARYLQEMESEGVFRRQVEQEQNKYSVLSAFLPYYQFRLCAVIDSNRALNELYDIPGIALICLVITSIVLIGIFLMVHQTVKPLGELTKKMSGVREGCFNRYAEVTGTEEIRELSTTYNYMLDDLNRYVGKLIEIQEEKRAAEIHALQMQINPHYMYNTLAGIKWLIYQGDVEKSTKTIDAFISLLRNTISNSDEFITIEQEVENLKNYVLINNVRYGETVQVEFFIAPCCEQDMVPKLILQPFIENAFFHAFPEGRKGQIQLFVREQDGKLRFEVNDNGIGMKEEQIEELRGKQKPGKEHFTGIGIKNVDDRIKLIYGMDYGIWVDSKEGEGTAITIFLPVRQQPVGAKASEKSELL